MKAKITNNPVYHKVFEYTESGTYDIVINKETTCKFVIVGGGGGGAYGVYAGIWKIGRNGGSGAMVEGSTTLSAGTYTVVVGDGGTGVWVSHGSGSAAGGTGGTGGDSTFLDNTAGGGLGGRASAGYYATSGSHGAGGTATAGTGGLGTNGVSGDTTGIYKDGYGAGGNGSGGSAEANVGKAGYAIIDIISDSSDYTYTVDNLTAKIVKEENTWKAFKF